MNTWWCARSKAGRRSLRRVLPRKHSPLWVKKQTAFAEVVHSVYEAGPFGFVLHKRLVALGFKNFVVRPRNRDEYGQKVKTDQRDALALLSCLARYLAGNTGALTVIRGPTDAEERARSVSRQREQLLAERKRLAAQGLGAARYSGFDLPEEWSAREKVRCIARGTARVSPRPAGTSSAPVGGGERRA